jgi:hypothetical protein
MKDKSFIYSFFFMFILLVLTYVMILIRIDPKQTIEVRRDNPYAKFHDNFELNKRQQMQRGENNFDTLILGSSTSEAFVPADVNKILNAKSFSASIGGGQTPMRYTFLNAGIEDFNELKQVIYVVDLFEFNHNILPGGFLYQSEFQRLSSSLELKRGVLDFMRYHFSNQIIESAISVIKKKKNETVTHINSDGTTLHSMILSPIVDNSTLISDLNDEQRKLLMNQVKENFYTYSTQVLNGFNQLNPEVLAIFDQMNILSKDRGIQMIYILAPYQVDFKRMILELPHLTEQVHSWRELFSSFSQYEHITVIDPFDSEWSENPKSSVWRDGIHFDRRVAFELLKMIPKRMGNE